MIEDMIGKIYCEDCLETMKRMPDRSVDLAWYDPPYNVGKDYGGGFDDLRTDSEYLDWSKQIVRETRRVSRSVCVFAPTKYIFFWWAFLGPEFKQVVLSWTPEGTFRGNWVNQFSSLLTDAQPQKHTKNVWNNCQMSGLGYFFRENTYGHPGYTSEDICSRVIVSFTHPGDVVYDPFMGSGSSAVASIRHGRRWIGSEINPDYVKIAEKRIANERAQMKMEFK